MVALDSRPVAMVEGTGFRRLVGYIEPGYKFLPPCTLLSVYKRYLQAKCTLIEMLKSKSHIALTTDIWTRVATQVYITVTVHFITMKWELKTCLLQIMFFPENHRADNIGDKSKEILFNFELDFEKSVAVVHDQGNNMQACFRYMKDEYDWESVELLSSLLAGTCRTCT